MGFLLQLQLLLWKNFTLKKRKPVMVIFEVVIPLVLFVILIGIRRRQPEQRFSVGNILTLISCYYYYSGFVFCSSFYEHFNAWPLPSSGLISVMQAFCDRGTVDPYGFNTYPNATIEDFLLQLNSVAENNNFFQPEFSLKELSQIPSIYKSFIEDPIFLKNSLQNATIQWKIRDILDNPNETIDFLVRNMSIGQSVASSFIHDTYLNKTNIFALIFGNSRFSPVLNMSTQVSNISSSILPESHLKKQDMPSRKQAGTSESHSFERISNSTDTKPNPEQGLIYSMTKYQHLIESLSQKINNNASLEETANGVGLLLKIIMLDPTLISNTSCSSGFVSEMMSCNISDTNCSNNLTLLGEQICTLTPEERVSLHSFIANQINATRISKPLKDGKWNFTLIRVRSQKFAKDLKIFMTFKKTVRALGKLASSLPQDYCEHENERNDSVSNNGSGLRTTSANPKLNISKGESSGGNETVKLYPNQSLPHSFSRIWKAMQKTVCAKEYKYKEEEVHSLNDMGLSKNQMEKVELLIHVLYNNPKVLYAPSGTHADKIIQQANQTFVLFDKLNQYAVRMVEVGTEMKAYLEENSTESNLLILSLIREDLQLSPFRGLLENEQPVAEFLDDSEMMNRDKFISELDAISRAACSWIHLMKGLTWNLFTGFRTEDEMMYYFREKAYFDNVTVLAAVVFQMNDDGSLPNHMIYKIRQNATFSGDTSRIRSRFWFPGPRRSGYAYYQFGFLWVQDILERAMVNLYSEKNVTEPGSYLHQFPYPCYLNDDFLFMIQHMMPLCLTISWVYSVAMLVQHIVHEKEQRLKEVMKMMGLKNVVHWIAWFITSFAQMTVTVGILTMMLKFGKVLTYSDPWIVFLTIEIFAITIIMYSFLVSVLYSKAKIAAACAGIIYFMSYVPYMYIAVREETANAIVPAWVKAAASLLAPTAFGLGAKYFAFYEVIGVGVQWNNFALSPAEDDEYHLGAVVNMLLVDSLLYAILVWYIENIHPGAFGLPRPWFFPFQRSYWFGSKYSEERITGRPRLRSSWTNWFFCIFGKSQSLSVTEHDQASAMLEQCGSSNLFEPDPENLQLGVSIVKLCKRYKGSIKYALKNLNLNFYEGQITALLGHNGAGKTTTMSILTGLFPPTSGSATIYQHDIRHKMDLIRKSLGMCPQHNVLFDEFTIEEHMWFYSRLKGQTNVDFDTETEKLISDLNLPHNRFQKVECLSGGMKRKLSVAIAFVGGSRTVILDEPTAGVDPYARRAIWDLIIKYKRGRTILLSTHHMDEADILGDRIAIIEDGTLKCSGSPLFLKHRLGEGYHLSIVKKMDPTRMSIWSACQRKEVTTFITDAVPTARFVNESKHELHYVLPLTELRAGNFEVLFKSMKQSKDRLFISSFGVKNTTLEEVFLKIIADGRPSRTNSDAEPSTIDEELLELETCTGDVEQSAKTSAGLQAVEDTNANINGNITEKREFADVDEDDDMLDFGASKKSGKGVAGPSIKLQNLSDIKIKTHDPEVLLDDQNVNEYLDRKTTPKAPQECVKRYDGTGEKVIEGNLLLLQQFWAILYNRYLCTRRNIEGLFSQILLPAFFVSVAMSVALAAPKIEDLPELILSPAQFYNLTQPKGNIIPFSNNRLDLKETKLSEEASSENIVGTFYLPSGIGATCILKNRFTATLHMNFSNPNADLDSSYFGEMCQNVFRPGVPLANYVPLAPTVGPEEVGNANATSRIFIPVSHERKYPICYCGENTSGFVCPTYGYTDPDTFRVVTGDVLLDVSGQNESQYYLYTTNMFRLRRYGALSFGHIRNFIPHSFGRNSPSLFRTVAVRHAAKVWYNNKGYHSMPTYLNVLNNAILRANLPAKKGSPAGYGITLINHPLPNTQSVFTQDEILQGNDVIISIFIIVAMSFVPASFVLFLVYERYTKSKHLQLISGVHQIVYWVANYLWDICNYTVPAFFCILILLIFDIPSYTSRTNFPAVVSLFLMYGWSITPVMYPASFLFKTPSSAYICMIVINLFVGITCIVTSFLLEVFSYDESLGKLHAVLQTVFLVFPNYCLGRGLMDIAFNEYYTVYLQKTGQYNKIKSPFAWDLIGKNLTAMAITGVTFFIITLLCEFNFFWKPRNYRAMLRRLSYDDRDSDVLTERNRVANGLAHEDVLRVENLYKLYQTRKTGQHWAVNRISWGIGKSECFGLLGVNGAGKSSTFRMLTGDTPITYGDAFIHGYSVKNDLRMTHKFIGYCPQFDALYDELSAREHLTFYAMLRGVPRKEIAGVVDWALSKLDLTQYADRPSGNCSGGNKRKLSTAIALIGGPSLIFLDEPTTGMDPHSKRFLWDLVQSLVREGRSIVFTSHSMEECEALCTRLTIMVNGKFECMGSTQHLKNMFGDGYSITLRCTSQREIVQLDKYFRRMFPKAKLKEKHHNSLHYELNSKYVSLDDIFHKMEKATKEVSILDYSVSQNTLDNVFINFVKNQNETREVNALPSNSGISLEVESENLLDLADEDTTADQLEAARISLQLLPDILH